MFAGQKWSYYHCFIRADSFSEASFLTCYKCSKCASTKLAAHGVFFELSEVMTARQLGLLSFKKQLLK